jgi:hypothetical protein
MVHGAGRPILDGIGSISRDVLAATICAANLRQWPKYSEAVIWGNSLRFPIQVTLPKALFFGKVRSEKIDKTISYS